MRHWWRRPVVPPVIWTCRHCDFTVTMPPLDSPGGHHWFNSMVFLHMGDHQSGRIASDGDDRG